MEVEVGASVGINVAVGVGMEVGIKDSELIVISPIKGSPAEKAGVLAGDKIVKIDDTVSSGLNVNDAVKLIRGKKGTIVKISFIRVGTSEPIIISIIRDVINIPVIETKNLISDKTFLIKINTFTSNSSELFKDALNQFIDTKYNNLIIDLRNNPGGYLEAAVDMGSFFIPKGKTIVTEDFGVKKTPQSYKSYGYPEN